MEVDPFTEIYRKGFQDGVVQCTALFKKIFAAVLKVESWEQLQEILKEMDDEPEALVAGVPNCEESREG